MKRESSSYVMSAVVVGTYICALYGARGTTVSARPPATKATAAWVEPTTRPAADAVADVTVEGK